MKISFLGNMNCLPFRYALKFKESGHDVSFFVDAKANSILNRPEYLYEDIKFPYPEWIQEVTYPIHQLLCFAYPDMFLADLIRKLNDSDIVFLNSFGHALIPFLDQSLLKVSIFSGSDLEVLGSIDNIGERARRVYIHPLLSPILTPFRQKLYYKWMKNHRNGISKTDIVDYHPKGINPIGEKILMELKSHREYERWELRGLDIKRYPILDYPDSTILNIFCGVRNLWKEPFSVGYNHFQNKGNDLIVRGLARFYNRTGIEFTANFVEKGPDVEETKNLCRKYGISQFINWFDPVKPSKLRHYYRKADICFDQCGEHMIGNVGLLAMLYGRPLIANARTDALHKLTGDSPICNSSTVEQIADWLEKLARSRELRMEIGSASREYVIRNYNLDKTVKFYEKKYREHISGSK